MIVLYEDDVFPKGKYEGKTVKEVYLVNPNYVKEFNDIYEGKYKSSFRDHYCVSDETLTALYNESIKARLFESGWR